MECSITQNKIEKFRFLDLTCKVHLYFFQLQGKSSVETNAYIRLIFINIFAIQETPLSQQEVEKSAAFGIAWLKKEI